MREWGSMWVKNVDECLVISENETRNEFLKFTVNAKTAKVRDGLNGKILKTCASQLCQNYFILMYSTYSYQLPRFPAFGKLKK